MAKITYLGSHAGDEGVEWHDFTFKVGDPVDVPDNHPMIPVASRNKYFLVEPSQDERPLEIKRGPGRPRKEASNG
jgi:hypothetical protein